MLYQSDLSEKDGKLQSTYGDTVEANRAADPRFRDPENGDLSLLADRPAIEAGAPIELPDMSFIGTSVNIGAMQSPAGWG